MKLLFTILASCLLSAHAMASPVSEAKAELKLLAQHCPKLRAAGGSCPDLQSAAANAEKLCRATYLAYSSALKLARGKVRDTEQWMATKQMVNETDDYVYISFNLRDDPDYPMIDSDNIVNDALGESLKNIYAVEGEIKEIRAKRSCSEKEIKKFLAIWSPAGKKSGMDRAHEKIANAISDYLIGAVRAFESGAHADAIRALERETGAKVTKVK